jgi:hypothetical protein
VLRGKRGRVKGLSVWLAGAFGVIGSAVAMWWQRRRDRAAAHAAGQVVVGLSGSVRITPPAPAADPAASTSTATPLAVHRSSGSLPAQPTPPSGSPPRQRRPVARHAPYVPCVLPEAVASLPLFANVPRHFTRELLATGEEGFELLVVDYTSADLRAPARRCVTLAIVRAQGRSVGEGLVDLVNAAALASMPAPVREALARPRPLAAQGRGEWLVVFPADGRAVQDDALDAFAADARALYASLVGET